MAYIISILYSVFLGSIFRNLFYSKYDEINNGISINLLITKKTVSIVTALFLLFLIDWVTFIIVLGPVGVSRFSILDIILLVFFVPSLTSLSFAVIFSLNTECEKFCLTLSLYYIFSTIGEFLYIGILLKNSDSFDKEQFLIIIFITFFYFLFKAICFFILYLRHLNKSIINPVFLTYVSLVLKPALIIFLFKFTDIANLIK